MLTLLPLEGFNAAKTTFRTLLGTIDLYKAFDTELTHLLIYKILNTHFNDNVKDGLTIIFWPTGQIIIIIIDKSLGTVGRLLLQGHSRRPK